MSQSVEVYCGREDGPLPTSLVVKNGSNTLSSRLPGISSPVSLTAIMT